MTVWREILDLARRTPSPHNTQPWKVSLETDVARLYLDPSRALPDEDVTGCFVVAALGMFVETVSIAAANRGFGVVVAPADLERAREAARGNILERVHVASLVLRRGAEPDPALPDRLIVERRTSRLAPSPRPIPAEALEDVRAEAAVCGQRVHLIDDPATVARAMRLNLEAVVEDLNEPKYHDEIVSWFRFTSRQEEESRDGLSARCMAMPGYEMSLLARFPGIARWPIVGPVVRALYRRRLGPTRRLMVMDGRFWDAEAAFTAGRCLMRLWLVLTRHGLSIHPFGNLITNGMASAAFRELTGIEDPWIVFRVGFTDEPPRSLRLELEDILVE
ncbi:MAG: hypothetical protein R3195_04855 [Gemmatimonadota bacterium]|nr:hypothetical protein [Gemmatimonadota bacterium]